MSPIFFLSHTIDIVGINSERCSNFMMFTTRGTSSSDSVVFL